MPNVCKICDEVIKTDVHFYKKHRIFAADYYTKYFPRKDLLSGESIIFENKIQYFGSLFNSSTHMKKWVSKVNKKDFKQALAYLIKIRHKIKNLNKPLCEMELLSLQNFPSLNLILTKIKLKEYKKIYDDLGIKGFFFEDYSLREIKERKLEIGVDTREGHPLKFKNWRPFKMDYGDYTALGGDFENVFIDRKTGSDCISTFGRNANRFKNEIERAASFGAYLIVLVETDIEILKNRKGKLFDFTKISPELIFHNIRDIIQSYDNIQFLFTRSRAEAKRCLLKILSCGAKVKDIDLQYLYNRGRL